jgi:hypothetical protein
MPHSTVKFAPTDLNDGWLSALQARQPKAVQPHLPKCFDGIRSLEFGGDSGADILAMLSGDSLPALAAELANS